MKTKLITTLRLCADSLLKGTFDYNWNKVNACNCGVLACALTGKSPRQLNSAIYDLKRPLITSRNGEQTVPTWAKMISYHCPITGFSRHQIFDAFQSAGLHRDDISQLEYLTDPKILARTEHRVMGGTELPIDYHNATDVAHYMQAWADILVEEGKDDVVPESQAEAPLNAKPSWLGRLFGRKEITSA